jgi:tripartite-type tricarboxylate transporter receptor subunit TctC
MRRLTLVAATLALLAGGATAQADYPERPITMIVPFAAGGPTDTVARLIAEPMTARLGQQVIVENVAGAGGTLAAGREAKADADCCCTISAWQPASGCTASCPTIRPRPLRRSGWSPMCR